MYVLVFLCSKVWMHECSSVLRLNLWRKRGIVNKLCPGRWFEYYPTSNETVLYPNQATFDPKEIYNEEETQLLEEYVRLNGILLNAIMDKEYVYSERESGSTKMRHFNFSGAVDGVHDVVVRIIFCIVLCD